MLAELARRIVLHRAAGGQTAVGGEVDVEGVPTRIVLGDDCQVQ